jgi:hypothetical protein
VSLLSSRNPRVTALDDFTFKTRDRDRLSKAALTKKPFLDIVPAILSFLDELFDPAAARPAEARDEDGCAAYAGGQLVTALTRRATAT